MPPAATSCASSATGSARPKPLRSEPAKTTRRIARAARLASLNVSVSWRSLARADDAGPASELRARDFFLDPSHVAIRNVQEQERDGAKSRLSSHPARYHAAVRRLMAAVHHHSAGVNHREPPDTPASAVRPRDHVAGVAQSIELAHVAAPGHLEHRDRGHGGWREGSRAPVLQSRRQGRRSRSSSPLRGRLWAFLAGSNRLGSGAGLTGKPGSVIRPRSKSVRHPGSESPAAGSSTLGSE